MCYDCDMKKQIIVAVATLAGIASVAGGGVLASNHYDTYKTNSTAVAQKAQADRDAEFKNLQEMNFKYETAYQHERIECEKGQAAYNVLPTITKAKTKAPVCGVPVIK